MDVRGDVDQLDEIHRGRRYVVTRARRRRDGSALVLKGVRADGADVAEAATRLEREYRLLEALRLAGVARSLTLERVDGLPVLVMEDAGARSLEDWLDRRALGAESFLPLARELAEALARLHAERVIHRDLHPGNVVIDARDHTTLIDFDGAISLDDRDGGVPPQLETITPYTAPEATGRMSRLVDQRADLYSLGAVFYELLTGGPPFSSSDPVELAHAHLARAPLSPRQLNPAVPAVLSDIVQRLLAKMPESRYQSAEALAADLAEASARLATSGGIAPFELGAVDVHRVLPLPDRLYQREQERARLRAAWERVSAGSRAVVVLSGPAGIGKSALTAELPGLLGVPTGAWLSGTFDRGGDGHRAIAEALRGLAREGQGERLRRALGPNARVLVEICRELAPLLGEPAEVPELGPVETETRFRLTFADLLRALGEGEQPLVLALADLQWADPASLRLLAHLAIDAELPRLMLLVALRPEEVGPEHPAARALAQIEAAGTPVERIAVSPLRARALTELVRDLLRCEPAAAEPLAAVVLRKTGGNPFFVWQLLRHLHRAGLLVLEGGGWTWDLARIESVAVTDNVVDLLIEALGDLPPLAQELVKAASCLGRCFSLDRLADVSGVGREAAALAMPIAVREGLLVPAEPAPSAPMTFQFSHDRVQQAAQLLLDPPARQALHLRAGRLLRAATGELHLDEQAFAIADHLHLAGPLVTDPAERLALVELDLRAAHKAKRASAPVLAAIYLRRALGLLPADAWRSHHPLTLALYRAAIESAHADGDVALAQPLFDEALAHCDSPEEQAALYHVCVSAAVLRGRAGEALRLGAEGLRLLGVELPADDDPASAVVLAELAAVGPNLQGRELPDLVASPARLPERERACLALLSDLVLVAHTTRPGLAAFILARRVNLCLRHGHGPGSGRAYTDYAALAQHRGDAATANAFGWLGVELARRQADPIELEQTLAVFAASVSAWFEPLYATLEAARQAEQQALQAGDLLFAVASVTTQVVVLAYQGVELGRLLAEIDRGIALARQVKVSLDLERLLAWRRAVCRLQGRPAAAAGGGGRPFGPRENVRLAVAYLLGDLPEARALAAWFGQRAGTLTRSLEIVDHTFYSALTLAEGPPSFEAGARLAEHEGKLAAWADVCPESYRHKHLLVAAERARVEGRVLEAESLYEQAIEAAAAGGFVADEGLANERFGRLCLALGRKRTAGWLLSSAVAGYGRWGATAKVRALSDEFPGLIAVDPVFPRAALGAPGEEPGSALDRMSLLSAAETISSEVVLERLLRALMRLCLATAGAGRGALVIEEEAGPFIRATGSAGEVVLLPRIPLQQSRQVPVAAIEEVRRTREALVCADAARDIRLAGNPHLVASGVRSLLALPIVRMGRLLGVLCLENDLATRAFSAQRIRVLQLLSSQIAISLENSLLFEKLTREIEDRLRAEARVRFLAESGAVLAQSLDYETTLDEVARLAVSFLADWCTINLAENGHLRRVVAAHRDPEREKVLREFLRLQNRTGAPPITTQAMETGQPMIDNALSPEVLAEMVPDPEARGLLGQVGARAIMTLPLVVPGKRLGAMSLVCADGRHRYGAEELSLAEELARRASLAIDHARLYREARQAVRQRDEFLSVASHELNTPLAALTLSLSAMGDALACDAGRVAQLSPLVSLADRQCRRLRRLVDDLFDVTRLERGPLRLDLAEVDLLALAQEAAASYAGALQRSDCPVTIHGQGPVPGRWDAARLEQVVLNLLANAAKFGAGKPIQVRVELQGELARLSVTDLGIGIDPSVHERIFGRFARAVSSDHYGGLGLGLYISRQIVQAHGGTLAVTSQPGEGATFVVMLPTKGGPGFHR